MGAYSIYGNPIVLESVTSAAYDSIGSWQGVTTFDDSDTSEELRPAINNLTAQVSTSAFSETWSSLLETTLRRTESLAEALDGVELEQPWVDNLDSEVSDMFEQVATIIKANQINIGNERDVFYVRLGGFDTHSDLTEKLADLLEEADAVRIQGLQGEVGLMRGSTGTARLLTCTTPMNQEPVRFIHLIIIFFSQRLPAFSRCCACFRPWRASATR